MNIYEKLVYENELGKSIELSFQSSYLLEDFEGRDGVDNSIKTVKGVNQIGTTFIKNDIKMRDIRLKGKIFNVNNLEYFKKELRTITNPQLAGTLTYTNSQTNTTRQIDCRVEKSFTNIKNGLTGFVIDLVCTNPYWYGAEQETELALTVNLLEFPFEFVAGGSEYSVITKKTAYLTNKGDIQTPVTVEFIGALTNPIVRNENTGEFIKVNTTLLTDEKLVITTHYGNKRVYKVLANGTIQNAFGLVDLSSKFFSLELGENKLTYDADSGADEAIVNISYKNQYLGV